MRIKELPLEVPDWKHTEPTADPPSNPLPGMLWVKMTPKGNETHVYSNGEWVPVVHQKVILDVNIADVMEAWRRVTLTGSTNRPPHETMIEFLESIGVRPSPFDMLSSPFPLTPNLYPATKRD